MVLDADLAGTTKTATFQKAFPERHFDFGITEANLLPAAVIGQTEIFSKETLNKSSAASGGYFVPTFVYKKP